MQPQLLREALDDALCCHAAQVLLVLCAGKRVSYPSNYDMSGVRAYAQLLHASDISLLDMVIAGSTGITSMRRLDMVPNRMEGSSLLAMREKYMAGMPSAQELARMQIYE